METRQLGTTDLKISPIGFGAWAIGGTGYDFAWGSQDDRESIAAIHRALEAGINWIDTAAGYGLGHSEEVVAKAIKELGSARRPYVFTKGSLVWDEQRRMSHSLKPDSLRREVDASLRRLQTDAIDLFQIHWPGFPPGSPASADLVDGWSALVELRKAGKLRHIGVSNFDVAELEQVSRVERPASLQPPYSLLTRGVEQQVLPYCQKHRLGVIVYSPMQSGLLSGTMTRERAARLPADDWRSRNPLFQEPALSRALALVDVLRAIGARHGRSPGEVAIAWTLRHPAVTGAIVGMRRPSQVDGVVGAADFRLSRDELDKIERGMPPAVGLPG